MVELKFRALSHVMEAYIFVMLVVIDYDELEWTFC